MVEIELDNYVRTDERSTKQVAEDNSQVEKFIESYGVKQYDEAGNLIKDYHTQPPRRDNEG